jgi:putative ATPase
MVHQESLFESEDNASPQKKKLAAKLSSAVSTTDKEPLAARMRPRTLDEIIGQEQIVGPGKILRRSIEGDKVTSMILWGPPGSGKTTLAEVIALHTNAHFVRLNATSAGVADLRKVVEEARRDRTTRTILFIDEIHRFNKAQQDAILPHVERAIVTLIGATTENPSFEVNSALLSRSRVFVLKALTEAEIESIMRRALQDRERGLGQYTIRIDENALQQIAIFASGDARTALNVLELAVEGNSEPAPDQPSDEQKPVHITLEMVEDAMQHRALQYDKVGEQHYNMISALHKAVRGSDPDSSIYWLVRMLEGGEDPLYLARRMVRMATEDIGMADPQALVVCVAAQQAVHFVGLPEGNLALVQAVVYLATAPKSNALYEAYSRVQEDMQQTHNDPVPLQIRNAPTRLTQDLDYGKDYKYPHDYYKDMQIEDPERPPAQKLQEYLPDRLKRRRYYEPGYQGKEASIRKWLDKRREI